MVELRPYQTEACNAVLDEWSAGHQKTLLVLPTGCHALGEKLLMADGSIRRVEDIHEGDVLLGPDGKGRKVLCRHVGVSEMYTVTPIKGKPFRVTGNHQLTLVRTDNRSDTAYKDIQVEDYLKWKNNQKHLYKLIRSGLIERFPSHEDSNLPIDPYFLGILIADGSLKYYSAVTTADSEVVGVLRKQAEKYGLGIRMVDAGLAATYYFTTGKNGVKNPLKEDLKLLGLADKGSGEKFIPDSYKYASSAVRLEILAGLIDGDGSKNFNQWDYVTKSERLADDIAFVCRSLGLCATLSPCVKSYGEFTEIYYRLSISGECSIVPCRVERKKCSQRKQKKSVLRTGFSVSPSGPAPYIGFTVDGDNRYLLDDFTITHNCGKTIAFSSVIDSNLRRKGGKALVLAHRGELLTQAADKLHSVCGLDCAMEKADSSALGSMLPVTLGSVQSLSNSQRLKRYPHDYFSTLVVDEAHHSLSDSYQRILKHFDTADVLGVTATPDRADKKELSEYYDSLAYEYKLTDAIRDKYLCPVQAQLIPLKMDISKVGISNGDYQLSDLGEVLDPYLERIADEMVTYTKGRKTLVFLPLVTTSKKFCDLLIERGLNAAEVNGNSSDRAEILSAFENGEIDILCNSMLLTEGWDCPSVDCIVVLRPTKVRSLYQQMVGRGMRLAEGKENLLLLDFLWMSEKHSLCKPSSLFSPDQSIADKVDEIIEVGSVTDLMSAEKEAERDAVAEREEALARELRLMRNRKKCLVDPLQFAVSLDDEALMSYVPTFAWEMGPATEKQLTFLQRCGIDPETVMNKGHASMIITRIRGRINQGLSTPKQINCLERYGFNRVGTWTSDQATRMIARISSNNWRLPYGINPASFIPGGAA